MPPKTKDFSAGVYTGLKSCPPHPAVDRAVQTDACLLPVGPMVISDDALRAALRARGLVGIPLEDLERQIIANIALHLRLDPTHSMEMLFTMWRVPRAVVEKMWGRWTPSQQDNDVILYEWLEIERVMNLVNLEPHLQWGMKNAKLHKVAKAVVGRTLLLLAPGVTVWHSKKDQQLRFGAKVHHFSDLGVMTAPRNLPYESEEVRNRFVAVALATLRKMADCKTEKYPLSGDFLRLLGLPKYDKAAEAADKKVLDHLRRHGEGGESSESEGDIPPCLPPSPSGPQPMATEAGP